MLQNADTSARFDSFLDAIASKAGLFAGIGLLIAICLGAGYYVQSVVVQLERNHAVFNDTQLRNGYVGMSDVQRLTLILQRAAVEGEMTEEMKTSFKNATDVLYVRTDNFEVQMAKGDGLETGRQSIAALRALVDFADEAIAQDFIDVQALAVEALDAAAEARKHMVRFLDDTRRKADVVLETQSKAIQNQQVFVLMALVGLALFGTAAFLFLRREVIGRQARERAERRVEFLAFYDPMTELPNRSQYQDRLQKLLDTNVDFALFFVDLDDFKLINDTYGHATGDAVLRSVASNLRNVATDNNGFAARLGGDEFAIVLPGSDSTRMSEIAAMVTAQASESVFVERGAVRATLSVGLSITSRMVRSEVLTVDLLSRLTDFALYEAKAAGRNCFKVYDQELEKRYLERRAMIDELPSAIQNNGLEVYFQPKVTLPGNDVYGFEALVRWNRRGQMVQPDQFIVLAEESGFVLDIDNFVLEESVRIVSELNCLYGTNYSVSVNLSALHFNSSCIVEFVQEVLWQSQLQPELLTLEITETMEVRDWKQAQKVVAMLHDLGCLIAIDDFGKGYSSLAYLRTTAADELKIDRSLIVELEHSKRARMLLSSVFDIARNLELKVTVEGIETAAQTEVVFEMGARQAQGYFFGRPGPANEVFAMVASGSSVAVNQA